MELIIDKLRKVLALTESDQPNEAQAAVRSLEKLLDKHHLTMADLMEETIYEGRFKFKNEDEKRIILQVAGMVTNSHSVVHYVSALQKNVVIFRLKKSELIDLHNAVEHYIKVYRSEKKKVLSTFRSAFIQKNELFPSTPDEQDVDKSPMSIENLWAVMNMMDTIQEVPYRKSLKA